MKKVLLPLIIIYVFFMVFIGCGDTPDTPDPTITTIGNGTTTTTTTTTIKSSYSETRSEHGEWDLIDIGYFEKSITETFRPNLDIQKLKELGYTKLKIDIFFGYRHNLVSLVSLNLRLRILDSNKIELRIKEFTCTPEWRRNSFSIEVPIEATNSNSGQFMIEWSRVEKGILLSQLSVGNRTITVTALK